MSCGGCSAAEQAIKRIEAGEDPVEVVAAMLQEAMIAEATGDEQFFGDDDKTRAFIKGLGLPKDGFFRACKEKLPESRQDITDTDEFCGKLKSAAVRLGVANAA